MNELLDLIKNIKVERDRETSFVYYDKVGKIVKISNRENKEESLDVLEVPTNTVSKIMSGERKLSDYVVNYDSAVKSLIVKEVTWEDNYVNELDDLYEIPIVVRGGYKKDYFKHFHFIPVYAGADVYIYISGFRYKKGTLVYYKNNIYKALKDCPKLGGWHDNNFELYLEDVKLVNKPQAVIKTSSIEYIDEFVDIPKIDVWYKELPYKKGQHVWINKNVYRIEKDTTENSLFDYTNNKLIVSNVKLFADENNDLDFDKTITVGDLILNNNKIQRAELVKFAIETQKEHDDNLFYINNNTLINYNTKKSFWHGLDLTKKENFVVEQTYDLEISDPEKIESGQLCIIGNSIYLAKIDHSFDLIISQNLKRGYWEIELNPRTRKYLKSSGFYPKDYIHFSLTAKHDPHILYRTFEFKLGDLIEDNKQIVPFKYNDEAVGKELSLYTPKYFDNYAHEILDD